MREDLNRIESGAIPQNVGDLSNAVGVAIEDDRVVSGRSDQIAVIGDGAIDEHDLIRSGRGRREEGTRRRQRIDRGMSIGENGNARRERRLQRERARCRKSALFQQFDRPKEPGAERIFPEGLEAFPPRAEFLLQGPERAVQ